jgi:hypothetical protein
VSEINSEMELEPLSAEAVQFSLDIVSAELTAALVGLSCIKTTERTVVVLAYILTAIFAKHPELFGQFQQLLLEFEPLYAELAVRFAAQNPQMWADTADDEVIFLHPSLVESLPVVNPN